MAFNQQNRLENENLKFKQDSQTNVRVRVDSTIASASGDEVTVRHNTHTDDRELAINLRGHICTDNTSTTVLSADQVFTGDWQDTLDFGTVVVGVNTDQASTADGLAIQWSADASTVHDTDVFTVSANTGKVYSFGPARRYVRLKYTNGNVDQSSFYLETSLRRVYVKPSSHRIQDNIVAEDDAELTKSVLTGLDTVNSTFKNVNVSQDGNLTISDNSSGLAIAQDNVTGVSFIHKFGNAPDFDQADGEITIWDGAEDGTAWENMVYDYSSTADIDSISSSNAGDNQEIEILGLNSNYEEVTQQATLNGQNRVALGTSLIRVYRAYNNNSTNIAGHVVIYPNTALTSGIPTDKSKIRAIIDPNNQQTEMTLYTVPTAKTAYLRSWYASSTSGNRASNYIIKLKAKLFNKVFRLRHVSSIADGGSSHIQHNYVEPIKFPAKTDIEMTAEMTASGGTQASVSAGFDLVLVDD